MKDKEKLELSGILIQLQQIDFKSVLKALFPFVIGIMNYAVTDKIIKGYILCKDYRFKEIKKVNLPPEVTKKYSNINIDRLTTIQFSKMVITFAKTILKNFPEIDLTHFYNNLNELKVKTKSFYFYNFIFRENVKGSYNAATNKINIPINDCSGAIFHELFHMTSSVYKNRNIYSGFEQTISNSTLAKGINEGYTQLLTERYFRKSKKQLSSYAYVYEKIIASSLEKIVNQEKMESLYLNANLLGLINEIKKYSSEEEIMHFITSVDFLNEHLDDKGLLSFEKKKIVSSLKLVNYFLLKSYITKLKKQLDDNIITEEDFITYFSKYATSLHISISNKNNNYELYSTNTDFEDVLQSILQELNIIGVSKIDKTLKNK